MNWKFEHMIVAAALACAASPAAAWSNHTLGARPALEAMPEIKAAPAIKVETLESFLAADEPDYGMDIGLWDDNGTAYGKAYGFGKQPFGNPALEFASQAPFHMGFFHESAIVYKAAGVLRRTYPEDR